MKTNRDSKNHRAADKARGGRSEPPTTKERDMFERVAKLVGKIMEMDPSRIRSKSRVREVVLARQVLTYILVGRYEYPPSVVAHYIKCDRSSIYHSVDKVEGLLDLPRSNKWAYGKVRECLDIFEANFTNSYSALQHQILTDIYEAAKQFPEAAWRRFVANNFTILNNGNITQKHTQTLPQGGQIDHHEGGAGLRGARISVGPQSRLEMAPKSRRKVLRPKGEAKAFPIRRESVQELADQAAQY